MNIERERARHALNTVKKLEKKGVDKYASYVKGLPATILQNGFGQAMATLLSAAKNRDADDHKLLYSNLEEWLCKVNPDSPYINEPDLMQAITGGTEKAYLLAQAEAMSYLEWLKKFANAYLSKPEGTKEEDG